MVFFVYPETAHKTLEELGSVFNDQTDDKETLQRGEKNAGPQDSEPRQSDASSESTLRGSIGDEEKKGPASSMEQIIQASTE